MNMISSPEAKPAATKKNTILQLKKPSMPLQPSFTFDDVAETPTQIPSRRQSLPIFSNEKAIAKTELRKKDSSPALDKFSSVTLDIQVEPVGRQQSVKSIKSSEKRSIAQMSSKERLLLKKTLPVKPKSQFWPCMAGETQATRQTAREKVFDNAMSRTGLQKLLHSRQNRLAHSHGQIE